VALAQAAVPLVGRSWLDFAGYLAHPPDEDGAAYEAEPIKA